MATSLKLKVDNSPKKEKKQIDEFRKAVIKYLQDEWISNYAEQKFIATTLQETRMTSSISDMPRGSSNQFRSVTELAAIQRAEAKRFLEIFHKKLDALPRDYRLIIEKKYLEVELDSIENSDEEVYQDLRFEKNTYFKKKKKALFSLGCLLLNSECS
ncbi:ArpU family phage packaging/lysis transcriptional regulator [Peribacillus asahii]|uniref:ArpU family phage packaging/lysis transcriptional regulator n=1 Tax=Peribacillus asahii TaxID=228899 RepID=UPI00207A1233|nr:ArpU family phage packaging/lysis transcriptional regulator [Peribacillus asahii]USK62327.1 hypothetical protein LIT37_22780 [Peribacillus asahii]